MLLRKELITTKYCTHITIQRITGSLRVLAAPVWCDTDQPFSNEKQFSNVKGTMGKGGEEKISSSSGCVVNLTTHRLLFD